MNYLQRVAVSNADLAKEKKKVTFVKNKPIGKWPFFKHV